MIPYFQGIDYLKFEVYNKYDLCATVEVRDNEVVKYEPVPGTFFLHLPFPRGKKPTIADVYDFFEDRSFPKTRVNIEGILKSMGLDHYDPIAMCKVNHGLCWDDYTWVRFEGEDITYDDIKVRD